MTQFVPITTSDVVALRKESVDRNRKSTPGIFCCNAVALRKESVDRNFGKGQFLCNQVVALRKESVDRNLQTNFRAAHLLVALRKESVDRNLPMYLFRPMATRRSPQGERG